MNKKAILALATLALLSPIVAACGGRPAASSEPAFTSEPAPESSESAPIIAGGIRVKEAIDFIARAGKNYEGPNAETLLAAVKEAHPYFSENLEANANERDVVALFYQEFKHMNEPKIGARVFQGSEAPYRTTKADEKDALTYLSETLRIYTPSSGTKYAGETAVTWNYVKTLADRMHAYMGRSAKDDFFTTVNHDYLYNKTMADARPSDSVYETNLISDSAIAAWVKDQATKVKNVNDFMGTYLDVSTKQAGQLGGLSDALKPLLAATTMTELFEKLVEYAGTYNYCPIFGKSELVLLAPNGTQELMISLSPYSYDYDASYTKTSSSYEYSVTRFTKVFTTILGSESEGKKYATAYSDFKYELGLKIKDNQAKANAYFFPEINKKYGAIELDFYNFLVSIGYGNPTKLAIPGAAALEGFLDLLSDENLDLIKSMIIWTAADHYAGALPASTMTDWMGYDFTDPTVQASEFSKNVTSFVQYPLAKNFLESDEGRAEIAGVSGIFDNLKKAMNARIANSFLSDKSKTAAKKKIDSAMSSFATKGSPSVMPYFDPDFLSIEEGGSYFSNMSLFDKAYTIYLDALTGPISMYRDGKYYYYIMQMEPLEANAFYLPNCNGIVITLGYMAAYSGVANMSEEEKLASYGWVMGHELSHGFDENGVNYIWNGDPSSLFTKADAKEYKNRTKAVAKYYDGYEVMVGQGTPGSTVSAEATADLMGMQLCLDIAKEIEGFDYQKFFEIGASNFGAYASQATYKSYLAPDEHPFGRARVNRAVSSFQEFYDAFGVEEGDNMYVAPESRPVIY